MRRPRVRHLISLAIDANLNMRTVATQFLQKLNDLRGFVFAEDGEFRRKRVAMSVQLVLVLLGDEHQHDDEHREQIAPLAAKETRVRRSLGDRA